MQFGESKFFDVLFSLYSSSTDLGTKDTLAPKSGGVDLFIVLLLKLTSTSLTSWLMALAGTAGGL